MNNKRRISTGLLACLLLAGSLILSACGSLQLPGARAQVSTPEAPALVTAAPEVIAEGRLAPNDFARLSFLTGGTVTEVLVKEGDQVAKGTVLARLDNREQLAAAVTAAEMEQESARQALDDLNQKAAIASEQARQAVTDAEQAVIDAGEKLDDIDTSDYQDDIDDAWEDVQDAKDDLKDAQEDVDKYKDLSPDNSTRKNAEDRLEDRQKDYNEALRKYDGLKNDLEQARAEMALAQAQLEDAQGEYESRKDGPDPDDLALAQRRVDNAAAQLAAAQSTEANSELVAPYDSTIVEVNVTAGEQAVPSQAAIVLADFSAWYAETDDLTELDVVKIDPQRPVKVTADALPDVVLTGQVNKIAQSFVEKGGDVLYTVRVKLDTVDPQHRWGMTVKMTFGMLEP